MNEKIKQASDYILSKISKQYQVGIVLGSGLGGFDETINTHTVVEYKDIPYFPQSTVPGHKGRFVFGDINGVNVMLMSGRFHYYEGYSMQDIAVPIRVMKLLGIEKLILSNAAGGINPDFRAGDFMLIRDHIKFFSDSPMRGKNDETFGERFFDMSNAYDKDLRELAKRCATEKGIALQEGVYAFMSGPNFETPAEIKMLGLLGADVVGMSTVPEVLTAVHCGIQVLGLSCVTNLAAGISKTKLTHQEVMEAGKLANEKFSILVREIVLQMEGME